MLDLYAAGENFEFLFALAERLVTPHIPYTPVRISIADHIRDQFGIDLRREPSATCRADGRPSAPSPATPFKDDPRAVRRTANWRPSSTGGRGVPDRLPARR